MTTCQKKLDNMALSTTGTLIEMQDVIDAWGIKNPQKVALHSIALHVHSLKGKVILLL